MEPLPPLRCTTTIMCSMVPTLPLPTTVLSVIMAITTIHPIHVMVVIMMIIPSTTNPNHVTANFPTDCASCHNENAWVPSSFDHDGLYFPIYSGEHEGEWNACTDCHTNPNNYAVFTCITCHTNPQTNNEHNGVGGYSYNSPACLACHPQGEATASSFNHNATAFPITGRTRV